MAAAPHRFPNAKTADFATIDDAIAATVLPTARGRARPCWRWPARCRATACRSPIALGWSSRRAGSSGLGLDEVILINDFEAQALSLPALGPTTSSPSARGETVPNAARVAVGPGTGLGAAALVHARGCWLPVPGEAAISTSRR